MILYLVHHGDAVGPDIDTRRPLSEAGRREVEKLAAEAAARGARPQVVWHSGKLRTKQTAEAFWRACNALAEFQAARDLQPDDPPQWIRDRLIGETRDVLIAGHFPHLPRVHALLTDTGDSRTSSGGGRDVSDATAGFPLHGVVALIRNDSRGGAADSPLRNEPGGGHPQAIVSDQGETWKELWRLP
jgi:phosphohistidine phosphatase